MNQVLSKEKSIVYSLAKLIISSLILFTYAIIFVFVYLADLVRKENEDKQFS